MTYEQSKYMNGNQNANAPQDQSLMENARVNQETNPAPKPQPNNNLTYEQARYNNQYAQRNADAQEGLKTRQDQVLSKRPGDGSQDEKNGFADTMKKGWDTVKGWFNPQDKSTQTGNTQEYDDREADLYNNVGKNTRDSMSNLEQTGKTAKEKIEKVMPKYSKQTWKNIMTSPEYSWDEKLELLMNGIGGALSAGDTGQVQQTNKKMLDDTITQQYAQNIADRDRRAMNAQIEPIEAANKEYTDLELRMRDTVAGAYIDRYKAAQDATTKQKVLEQLIEDSDTWAGLDIDKKIDMLSYIQALDGKGSLLSMAIQKYAPDLFEKFDTWVKSGGDPSKFPLRGEPNPENTEYLNSQLLSFDDGSGLTVSELSSKYRDNPQLLLDYIASKGLDPATTLDELEESLSDAYIAKGQGGRDENADYNSMLYTINKARKKLPKPPKTENVPGSSDKKRKDNATDVQNTMTNIQSSVTNGKMTPDKALRELDKLGEKVSNMEDNTGNILQGYESLKRQYVIQDVENNIGDAFTSGSDKMMAYDKMAEKHAGRIANDPELQEKMSKMLTEFRYQNSIIDPFMKKSGNELGNNVALGNDGKIYYRGKKGNTEMDIATVNWNDDKERTLAENVMQALYDKTGLDTVTKNFGNVPAEEIGTMFRETPIYKQMESMVKDKNMQNIANAKYTDGTPKYPNMKVIYDNMDKRLKMWSHK